MYEFSDRLQILPYQELKILEDYPQKDLINLKLYIWCKRAYHFPRSFDRADMLEVLILPVISSKGKDHSYVLLEKLNFPFIKRDN